MKQRRRIYYTDGQKAVMWERWRKGESLQQIAQLGLTTHKNGKLSMGQNVRCCKCDGERLLSASSTVCYGAITIASFRCPDRVVRPASSNAKKHPRFFGKYGRLEAIALVKLWCPMFRHQTDGTCSEFAVLDEHR